MLCGVCLVLLTGMQSVAAPLCSVAGDTESFPLRHICPRAAAEPDFSRPRKCTAQGFVSRVGWLSPSRDLGNLFWAGIFPP